MKTKDRKVQAQNIARHVANLATLLNVSNEQAIVINRKLRGYERKLKRLFTIACERQLSPMEDQQESLIEKRVRELLGNIDGLKFNHDPRGYAIKIDDEVMRAKNINLHKDWGGYGILSP